MYSEQILQLISGLDAYHRHFHDSKVFSGPSLYFHQRALVDGRADDATRFSESSYAMLTAWGMHRMGKRGAKMNEFGVYQESIHKIWPLVRSLRTQSSSSIREEDWETIKKAFFGIKAMRSSFSLVANSKVLAHAIPNLVPPVDREYTIRFLQKSKVLPKNIEGEWNLLRDFLQHFFYPLLANQAFIDAHAGWCNSGIDLTWNTSPLKTVDNLVVGYSQMQKMRSLAASK